MEQKKKIKSKLILVIIFILILVIFLYLGLSKIFKNNYEDLNLKISKSENINVVPTRNDTITRDSAWCATFQLVWDDLINELVGKDIEFDEKVEIVENLNKQDFTENDISEEYYYKKFGLKTLDLKNEIENGIKSKFNETSDVLEDIDWSPKALDNQNSNENRYIFYTMLKRNFTYPKEFKKLEEGEFANKYQNIKYFGIDDSTEKEVRDQVIVLYYNSANDCAVALNTVQGDQVILSRGNKQNTFAEIYYAILDKSNTYEESTMFGDKDFLKIPEISFKVKREYKELENEIFYTQKGEQSKIEKAIQSIQMNIDEKGGSVKSEAVMDVMVKSAMPNLEEKKPRYFYFDDEYDIFLLENGKEKPYFAVHVSDITKFQ